MTTPAPTTHNTMPLTTIEADPTLDMSMTSLGMASNRSTSSSVMATMALPDWALDPLTGVVMTNPVTIRAPCQHNMDKATFLAFLNATDDFDADNSSSTCSSRSTIDRTKCPVPSCHTRLQGLSAKQNRVLATQIQSFLTQATQRHLQDNAASSSVSFSKQQQQKQKEDPLGDSSITSVTSVMSLEKQDQEAEGQLLIELEQQQEEEETPVPLKSSSPLGGASNKKQVTFRKKLSYAPQREITEVADVPPLAAPAAAAAAAAVLIRSMDTTNSLPPISESPPRSPSCLMVGLYYCFLGCRAITTLGSTNKIEDGGSK